MCLEQGAAWVTWALVCLPQPCPEAIRDVFENKFHIIGAVGIGIAVVMVSVKDAEGSGPVSGKHEACALARYCFNSSTHLSANTILAIPMRWMGMERQGG